QNGHNCEAIMNNQVIGTAGVFTVTFLLLALRHLLLSIAGPNRDRHIRPVKPGESFEMNPSSSRKNSWAQWPTPPETVTIGHPGAMPTSAGTTQTSRKKFDQHDS